MTKRGRYAKKANCSFSVRSNGRSTTLSRHYRGIIIIPLSDVRSSPARRRREDERAKEKKKEEAMTREGQ